MSKREEAIYKRAVKDTLTVGISIIAWSGLFITFLIKSGIYVF